MAKKKKPKKAQRPNIVTIDEHVLDRLYLVIDSRKGAIRKRPIPRACSAAAASRSPRSSAKRLSRR